VDRLIRVLAIRADGNDVLLAIKVVPGARRTRIAGVLGDRLKITVAAPPEKGRANEAICVFLAERCGVPARDVIVERGHANPLKSVRIRGANAAAVRNALAL
jgi:uncharacterized protein (TIGR00251 family)